MDNLDKKLQQSKLSGQIHTWQEPTHYRLTEESDKERLSRFLEKNDTSVVDPIERIADDLYELRHPNALYDASARAEFCANVVNLGKDFGEWVHFPWRSELIHYPNQEDHQELRTFRNRNLVTKEEQQKLLLARVAIFGMSVGSNVAEQLVRGGIGGAYTIGDPDTIAPSNLNRLRMSMRNVGMSKIDAMAQVISEVDPYIEQTHVREGFSVSANDQMSENLPDIIFDEVDNLAAKAQLRWFAKQHRLPLVMVGDLGDNSVVDVERHDLAEVTPFNGRITEAEYDDLLADAIPLEKRQELLIRVAGAQYLSQRLLGSAAEIGKSLAGIPQLGSTAITGAGLAEKTAREILLGHDMPTGVYAVEPAKLLNSK